MKILIFRLIVTYFLIATFILINLLFNKNVKLGKVSTINNKFIPAPNSLKTIFSLFWIILLPRMIYIKLKYFKGE